MGTDPSKDLTDRWWERVYNESSKNIVTKNIVVSNKIDRIEFNLIDKDGVEVTTKSYSMKKLKEKNMFMTYGSFLKSATKLANVGVEEDLPDHVQTDDITFNSAPKTLTDEELFAACGGRTAHKGARHGLNLTGKLSRIEEQDNLLMAKLLAKEKPQKVFNEWTEVTGKKYKLKPLLVDEKKHMEEEEDDLAGLVNNTEYVNKISKKERKEMKNLERSLANKISNSLCIDDDAVKKKDSSVLMLKKDANPIVKSKGKKKKKKLSNEQYIEFMEGIKSSLSMILTPLDPPNALNTGEKKINKKNKKSKKNKPSTSTSMVPDEEKKTEKKPVGIRKLSCTDSEGEDNPADEIDIIDKINQDREQLLTEFEKKHKKAASNKMPKKLQKIEKKQKNKKKKKQNMDIQQLTESLQTISKI